MQNNTLSKNRQAFYSQLESMFAGRELENFKGKSGFANLLSIKSEYFKHIKKELESKIKKTFNASNTENELYVKAFTFFDSFLNETGCPYFNKTEFYKNLYEKVYTNSSDTALFYKTSKLYYVKSDSVPANADYDIKNDNEEISRAKIIFEVSDDLKYSSTNEKKELKFILKDLSKGEKSITLLVLYKGQTIDLGDDYSFELNSKISDKEYELTSSNKTNLNKFDELLDSYELDITPNELSKAIHTYKKQREVDFFIHKDSANFLKEQFNLYMYSYLFNDDEIKFNDWDIDRLQQIKNIKEIIFETIELISKFEDELRAMWLKPKFVRGLNYIITLDKIDENLHNEIIKNKDLLNEWKELELSLDNKYLPVDTQYLTSELKYKILSSFNNLDEITDGVLIKSDNFQALNTILPKYKGLIDLMYIDPPFNTGSDFEYKDKFQDSSWLTLMENRLTLSKDLLSDIGSFYLHLDENANYRGRELLNNTFGAENFQREIVWDIQVLSGFKTLAPNWIRGHDLILYYSKNPKPLFHKLKQPHTKAYEDMFTGVEGNRKYMVAHGSKRYWDEVEKKGKPFGDVWSDIMSFQQQPTAGERIKGNITQKPETLTQRIIKASTNKNSFVMDYFSGSGTTINTAHKLGRKWIGVEMGNHFETVNIPRIKKTLSGLITGISKKLEKENNLKKGGIVKYYELETYEDVLSKAQYSLSKDSLIDLYQSEKLATNKVVNIDSDSVKLNINEIYNDIDIFETISNTTGFRIKKLYEDRCIFLDGDKEVEVKKDKLLFSEYPFLRKLVWWK
ncbi:MAG: DNA methyltransferase [Sulfurimonas sp.]|nr:DNA methyltransferase [Sulfurimonas sp.]